MGAALATAACGSGGGQDHAHAGPSEVDRRQAHHEGDCGHGPEVGHGLDEEAAEALEVAAVAGDPDDQSSEDDGDHDRLDHAEEHGRERLELGCLLRRQPADQNPCGHPNEDPVREGEAPQGEGHTS